MRNLVLSTQRMNILNKCPRLYFFLYTLKRAPIEKAKYFTEGEYIHQVLDIYYTMRKNKNFDYDTWISQSRELALKVEGLTIKECEFLLKLAMEYREFHQNETWEIENSEVPFAKVLLEDEKYDLRIIVQGKADLLIRSQSIPVIVDHKKVSQNREPSPRDNQILAYCWAFNRYDFIINQLGMQKTLAPQDKFNRHYFNVTGYQIEEWMDNTIYLALEAVKYSESKFFPARFDACKDGMTGKKCAFHNVCQSPQESWEEILMTQFKKNEEHDLMGEIE